MTAQLSPLGVQKFYDNNGNPLAFGLLYTYAAGTTNAQASYVDSTQTTQNTNPIQLNFRGECNLWLDPTLSYKLLLTDSAGNTIPNWPVDNIPGGPFINPTGSINVPVNLIPTPTNTFTLGNSTHSWAQLYLGANASPALDTVSGIIGYYPRTSIEITASVTPTNFSYAWGDLRRYGAKIDGSTDDTTAINNAIKVAIAGLGFFYHPGGICVHASQILAGNGFSGYGNDRTACIFKYTGSASSSGWRITNNGTSSPTINSSGSGLVNLQGLQFTTSISSSAAAALEINACGYAFYTLQQCRFTGSFRYGLILDGVELGKIANCIIDNNGNGVLANAVNIWLVNGADRTAGQAVGFTNSIWIQNCNLNISGTGSNNIADDGGSNHYIRDNNCNGAAVPIRICGVGGFEISGNEMENALGGAATGEANIDFLILTLGSASVGPCFGGVIQGNYFGADMAAGSSSLRFGGGGSKHYGIRVHGNYFRENSGDAADVYVTNLGNSEVGPNYHAAANGSVTPYTGTHSDADGNHLWPPQNGYLGAWSGNATWADTRYVNQFLGGVSADSPNGLQIDEQQWQSFTIQIINNAGTLQIQIFDSGVSAATAAYANKLLNASASAVNLPTVSAGAGFGSTPGGLVSGSTSVLVLNVANAQTSGKNNQVAFIEQYNGNVAVYSVYCGNASRNINGVTLLRPEIRLVNAQSGAIVNFDTTLLPAGKIINIKFSGYLA